MTGLPRGWCWCEPDDLADRASYSMTIGPFGSDLKVSDYCAEGVPLVFVREIRAACFGDERTKFVSRAKAEALRRHYVRPGDLLITKMGDPPGDTAIYPANRPPAIITADCIKLTPCVAITSSEYLSHCLRSPAVKEQILEKAVGVAQQKLSLERFRSIRVPLAPFPEQKRIADKLDALVARVNACRLRLDRVAAILKRFRQSVLAAAVSGELTREWRESASRESASRKRTGSELVDEMRAAHEAHRERAHARGRQRTNEADSYDVVGPANAATGNASLPDVPGTWAWATGADVVEPGADIVYGIVQPGPKLADGVPYVRGMDIVDGHILVHQLMKTSPEIAKRYERSSLKPGDVVLGIIRATKVATVPDELSGGNITQGTARFRPCPGITSEYLSIALQAPRIQDWLHAHYRGIDMPGLNLADVRRVPIPVPPLEEQNEIARRVAELWALASAVECKQAAAASAVHRITSATLAAAFRGELVPHDADDEPASVLLERIREQVGVAAHAKPSRSRRASPRSRSPAEPKRRRVS